MNYKTNDNIEELYATQLMWGVPIEYKKILIYPVKCEDIQILYSSIYTFLYDPLRYPAEISTLPRLYFLTDIINHIQDMQYVSNNILLYQLFMQLQFLLKLILGENQSFDFISNNNRWFIRITTTDGEIVDVKTKDFEQIRKIVLHQNGIDYDDTFVHEDIRKWIVEQESEEKNKQSPSLEDNMEAFMIEMGNCDIEAFKQVPMRRFNRIVRKILSRENYTIQMTASMSGFVTFKGEIEHWLTVNKKNSIYDKYFKEIK